MPDKSGKLTPEEQAKARSWIESHLSGSMVCPLCKHVAWTVSEHLANIQIMVPGASLVVGSPTYPNLMLFCNNCGYTTFVNAVMAQALSPPTDGKGAGNG